MCVALGASRDELFITCIIGLTDTFCLFSFFGIKMFKIYTNLL